MRTVLGTLMLTGLAGLSGAVLEARQTAVPPRLPSLEARTLYLRGVQQRASIVEGGGQRANIYAQRAIRADSLYSDAWALLAETQLANVPAAKAAALRAVALDSGSANAWLALARAQMAERDFAASDRSFQKALAIEPKHPRAGGWYSRWFLSLGRLDEALRWGREAADVNPIDWGEAPIAPLTALGRYDEAIAVARAGLAIDSNQTENGYYAQMAVALLAKGQNAEALRAFARQREVRRSPLTADAWAYARAGQPTETRAVLRDLLAIGSPNQAQQINIAGLYANLGVPDSAFIWLERAYPQGGMTNLRWQPQWEPIRGDPRFKGLLRRIGLEK